VTGAAKQIYAAAETPFQLSKSHLLMTITLNTNGKQENKGKIGEF
jgi:hypothetical protein